MPHNTFSIFRRDKNDLPLRRTISQCLYCRKLRYVYHALSRHISFIIDIICIIIIIIVIMCNMNLHRSFCIEWTLSRRFSTVVYWIFITFSMAHQINTEQTTGLIAMILYQAQKVRTKPLLTVHGKYFRNNFDSQKLRF